MSDFGQFERQGFPTPGICETNLLLKPLHVGVEEMCNPELDFLERRVAQESVLALGSTDRASGDIHRQLAAIYRERANRLRFGAVEPLREVRAA